MDVLSGPNGMVHRLLRSNESLQLKVVLWTLLLVFVPTLVCAFWFNRLTYQTLEERHSQSVELFGQTAAASLSGSLQAGWSTQAADVINHLALDPRISFIEVVDVHGKQLYQQTLDRRAWALYEQHVPPSTSRLAELSKPQHLGEQSELISYRVPVWNRPLDRQRLSLRHMSDLELQGFLIIGMRDAELARLTRRLQMAQLGAACLVCLIALPVVIWAVRRWLRPLRELTQASVALANNRSPQPVRVRGRDELGQLAGAFNNMVRRLSSARQALQQANAQLEQKVAQRTAELHALNQRLQTEIHDKNEFLRAVTHDLGAPLRNIAGMARMLRLKYETALNDDAMHKIDRIAANADLQHELLDELLELSRIRTRPGRKETVDLNELVDQLRQAFSYDLQQSRIELIVQGDLPVIFAERNRMRQVFQNLLDNAIKYMHDSPTRQITIQSSTLATGYQFTVSDTGGGIAAEDLPHVFQVFRRARHSGSHHLPGRGVGLASVKTIIETYGGEIHVTSELGRGATFTFTLAHDHIVEPKNVAA